MKRRLISVFIVCLTVSMFGYVLFRSVDRHDGELSIAAHGKSAASHDNHRHESSGSELCSKRQRVLDQVTVPTSISGIEEVFGEAAVGDEVTLFQDIPDFEGFSGTVSMLHTMEDGSQTARLTEQSTVANGTVRRRILHLVSSQDGYEGFLRQIFCAVQAIPNHMPGRQQPGPGRR